MRTPDKVPRLAEHVEYLRALPCETWTRQRWTKWSVLWARSLLPAISGAVMQINGGWLCGLKYDLCLAYLLQNGCLEPSGYGVFRIDRRKLPLIEVENPIADAMESAEQEIKQASLFA